MVEKRSLSTDLKRYKYDIFLAAPVSAVDNNRAYQRTRSDIKKIFNTFVSYGLSVYWAAEKIEKIDELDSEKDLILDSFHALDNSQNFVLVYSEKIVTSTLVEAGYALAMKKRSIYFIRDKSELPFLLRNSDEAFPFVKIFSGWSNFDDLVKKIHDSDFKKALGKQ